MTTTVKDLMTTNPTTLGEDDTALEAARMMRDSAIGDVLVTTGSGELCGIVTDRDIVVRCLAEDRDPSTTKLGSLCSKTLATLSPDAGAEDAVKLMEQRAIRRLPVVDGDRPVGILSIGDLAVERDRRSALGEISAAPPSR